jgi:hypothetical protein
MSKLEETLKQGIMIELDGYHHYHTASQPTRPRTAAPFSRCWNSTSKPAG